jgi:hypothetical protein
MEQVFVRQEIRQIQFCLAHRRHQQSALLQTPHAVDRIALGINQAEEIDARSVGRERRRGAACRRVG